MPSNTKEILDETVGGKESSRKLTIPLPLASGPHLQYIAKNSLWIFQGA